MEIITNQTYFNQAYYLSIVSIITSFIFGMGIFFAIPCLIYTIFIKNKSSSLNNERIDKSIFFSLVGLVLSVFFMALEFSMIF